MKRWLLATLLAARVAAAQGPSVEHQPVLCTIPAHAVSLCATVTAETPVARVRIYFRRAGEKYYNLVEMSFGGMQYCGTLPPPRGGRIQAIDYYLQALDEKYEATLTNTYQMMVKPEGSCEFPPLEKDPNRARSIRVYATNPKQGKDLDSAFENAGVTFVPLRPR